MRKREDDLLMVQDVANLARDAGEHIGPGAVRLWDRTGKLPAVRSANGVRLWRRSDVERFLTQRRESR